MKTEARARPRPYRMSTRAHAVAATAERVLDAAAELFLERLGDDFALEEVAERAGVSRRTVIRRFGAKQDLVAAATERQMGRVQSQRDEAPVGDARGAVRVLCDHYEELGDRTLLLLSEEGRRPALQPVVEEGRQVHVDWCERVFAPALTRLSGSDRRRRLAQLVTVCDVYTWKLLRRDRRLGRRQTELALSELLEPLVKEA